VSKNRAVFLDRDGVLIRAFVRDGIPRPPASLDELEVLPGVVDACGELRDAGFLLICVTNQPDIARGAVTAAEVEALNDRVQELLGLDAVLTCPHDDADECDCRKPRPGLLLRAAARFDVDLTASVMVGDRWRDIEAGRAAGCATVFVRHGYAERQPENPDLDTDSLGAAVSWLLDWGRRPPDAGARGGA
jgi:D-glycero-D-manno-heptose 1,7-bisphosphate phosphatase